MDQTSRLDSFQQLEPISTTNTLLRRIKRQLNEIVLDAPAVYLQELIHKYKYKYFIMSEIKSTVQIRVTRTVPLVKLSSSILDRQVHIGKKT